MWCIGRLTEEYRSRMYDLLDLYARPYKMRCVGVGAGSGLALKHFPIMPAYSL